MLIILDEDPIRAAQECIENVQDTEIIESHLRFLGKLLRSVSFDVTFLAKMNCYKRWVMKNPIWVYLYAQGIFANLHKCREGSRLIRVAIPFLSHVTTFGLYISKMPFNPRRVGEEVRLYDMVWDFPDHYENKFRIKRKTLISPKIGIPLTKDLVSSMLNCKFTNSRRGNEE